MNNDKQNPNDVEDDSQTVPTGKWILVLVAHDDDELEPQVLKERIARDEDEQLAAFMRGGELVAVIGDVSEVIAEAHRFEVEKECLRIR